MNYKVILTDMAVSYIKDIDKYIAINQKMPETAYKFINEIKMSIESLKSMPERHRRFDHPLLKRENIRVFPYKSYLIFYNVNNKKNIVEVLRVVSTSKDIDKIFKKS